MITIIPQMNTARPQMTANNVRFGSISKSEHELIDNLADKFKKTGKYPDLQKDLGSPNGEHKSELLEALKNAINKAIVQAQEQEPQAIKEIKEINQKYRKSV